MQLALIGDFNIEPDIAGRRSLSELHCRRAVRMTMEVMADTHSCWDVASGQRVAMAGSAGAHALPSHLRGSAGRSGGASMLDIPDNLHRHISLPRTVDFAVAIANEMSHASGKPAGMSGRTADNVIEVAFAVEHEQREYTSPPTSRADHNSRTKPEHEVPQTG